MNPIVEVMYLQEHEEKAFEQEMLAAICMRELKENKRLLDMATKTYWKTLVDRDVDGRGIVTFNVAKDGSIKE